MKFKTEQYDLQGEEFRDLVNYPQIKGIYQISNYGRCKTFFKSKPYYSLGGRVGEGYLGVQIYFNGKIIARPRIHDLVVDAFIRVFDREIEECHHLNHIKTDNRLANLQIIDKHTHRAEDEQTKRRIGLKSKGRRHTEETKQKLREAVLNNPRTKDPVTGRFVKI